MPIEHAPIALCVQKRSIFRIFVAVHLGKDVWQRCITPKGNKGNVAPELNAERSEPEIQKLVCFWKTPVSGRRKTISMKISYSAASIAAGFDVAENGSIIRSAIRLNIICIRGVSVNYRIRVRGSLVEIYIYIYYTLVVSHQQTIIANHCIFYGETNGTAPRTVCRIPREPLC